MTSIPEVSARGSLILWSKCQIPVGPRSDREGERCRPLDHIRQIPFIHQLCSHYAIGSNSLYIQSWSSYFLHMVFTLCLKTLHIYYLRMRSSRIAYFKVLRHFGVISSCMWYFLVRYRVRLPLKLAQIHSNILMGRSTCEFYEFSKANGVKYTLIAPQCYF